MFYSTGIPVSLWFVDMDKTSQGEQIRKGETLFIDARDLGEMVDRTHREFSKADIMKVADTYHAYRGTNKQKYEDVAGFCKIASKYNIIMFKKLLKILLTITSFMAICLWIIFVWSKYNDSVD